MNCAFDAYINLVPIRLREDVVLQKKDTIQELRLRCGRKPVLVTQAGSVFLDSLVSKEDLSFVVNVASRYSPWTVASLEHGYITALGGHRVGVCGEVAVSDGKVMSFPTVTSVSLRVCRDFPGISGEIKEMTGSILIIGQPGTGKTTLVRDLVRSISNIHSRMVSVVDERRELFPVINGEFVFSPGDQTDVLSGCSKTEGIEMALRTMTPQVIAVDEITAWEDCKALLHAAWCGVTLLATAHAACKDDLLRRKVYKPLIDSGIFENIVILHPDKSWSLERIE